LKIGPELQSDYRGTSERTQVDDCIMVLAQNI